MKKKSLFTSLLAFSTIFTLIGCKSKIFTFFGSDSKSHQHKYVYVDEVPATCTVDGVEEHYTCEGCDLLFGMNKNEVTLDDLVIKAHHTLVTVDSKQETCTEDGYYTYYHCEVCQKNFADEEGKSEIDLADITIPKKGHNIHFHEAVSPTCTEDGNIAYYQCDNCHKYYSDEQGEHELTINDIRVLALGHDLLHHESIEATCTTDGNKEYYECQRCHNFYSDAEGKKQIENNSWIIEGHHEMEHVDALKPTFEKDGNIEHYHCDKCNKNFSDEAGENEITTPVIIPALPKHLDFEDDNSLSMIVNTENVTSTISEEQHHTGNKSLKVVVSEVGSHALVISDEYYDMLPEEGFYFNMYSADVYNACLASGRPVYNAEHQVVDYINYWGSDSNIWREYHVSKASINPEKGNHWVFYIMNITTTFYLDDIRPFTKSFSFDNSFDRLSIIDDSRNNVSLSTDHAVSGKTSLKVDIVAAHQQLFLVSKALYNSLPEEGITFSVFCDAAFNAGVYDPDSTNIVDTFHYYEPLGVWKQYTIAKKNMAVAKDGYWICIPRTVVTVYIDDIFFANIADDATGTGFEESYSLLIAKGDERNHDVSISQDFAYEGNNSLKVVNTGAHYKGLIISDTFYDKLPEEGITFYLYATEKIFNCFAYPATDDSTLIPYYAPLGEWKKATVKKANINPTSGDHWVFLIGDTTTVYIDDIRIATAS